MFAKIKCSKVPRQNKAFLCMYLANKSTEYMSSKVTEVHNSRAGMNKEY